MLPVVDGFKTVVTESGNLTLRVPEFAHVSLTDDCQKARFVGLDYLWYEGKLIPEGINRFKVPSGQLIWVRTRVGGLDSPETFRSRPGLAPWRFDPALPHKKYPLEMYPRAYWRGPDLQPPKAPPDVRWGVRGTTNPLTDLPFSAACDIVRTDPSRQESVVDGEFAKNGDAKCRGWVYAVVGKQVVGGMVDVWADGAMEIDHIYNAAAKQFATFIIKE